MSGRAAPAYGRGMGMRLSAAACRHFFVGLLGLALAVPAGAGEPQASRGEHAVHAIARSGSADELGPLLAAEPALRDRRTALGATPLHMAALNLDPGPMKLLLAAGAEVDARDAEGRTPLHLAAFGTRREQVMLLLRAGADPRAQTLAGRDVLSLARKVRADEIAGEISLWILKGCSRDKPC